MATWVLSVAGQDGRTVYVEAKRNARGYHKKPLRVATTYPSQLAAEAQRTALAITDRHPECVAVQIA